MSPILGIWASARQPALNANSYESIATVTVGSGGSASISFTSIPSTYTHLQIRAIGRSSTGEANITIAYNSDTGANYASHDLYGDGSSAAAAGGGSRTPSNTPIIAVPISTDASNIFGVGVVDILDYASTSKYKTIRSLSGFDKNGATGYILLRSQLWMNTNAISTITLSLNNFVQYSQVALYGIKGA